MPGFGARSSPDTTRHLLGFADPFPPSLYPQACGARLLAGHAHFHRRLPDRNPTRNRDLDLLPLLLHFDRSASVPRFRTRRSTGVRHSIIDCRTRGSATRAGASRRTGIAGLPSSGWRRIRERLTAVGRAYLAFEGEEKSWADIMERVALS